MSIFNAKVVATARPIQIGLVFSNAGLVKAQEVPRFKNKPADYEHPFTLVPCNERAALARSMWAMLYGTRIRYITSLAQSESRQTYDIEVVRFLCEKAALAGKGMSKLPGFEKLDVQELAACIEPIYIELIENSQKAIMTELLKNKEFCNMAKRSLEKRGEKLDDNPNKWIYNRKIRMLLMLLAAKQNISASAVVSYRPNHFSLSVQNNTYLNHETIKLIRDNNKKVLERVLEIRRRDGSIAELYADDDFRLGAGLGTAVNYFAILNIAETAGVGWAFGPAKNKQNHAIVTAEFFLDRKFSENPTGST